MTCQQIKIFADARLDPLSSIISKNVSNSKMLVLRTFTLTIRTKTRKARRQLPRAFFDNWLLKYLISMSNSKRRTTL